MMAGKISENHLPLRRAAAMAQLRSLSPAIAFTSFPTQSDLSSAGSTVVRSTSIRQMFRSIFGHARHNR
jgi:hypothetical protein